MKIDVDGFCKRAFFVLFFFVFSDILVQEREGRNVVPISLTLSLSYPEAMSSDAPGGNLISADAFDLDGKAATFNAVGAVDASGNADVDIADAADVDGVGRNQHQLGDPEEPDDALKYGDVLVCPNPRRSGMLWPVRDRNSTFFSEFYKIVFF